MSKSVLVIDTPENCYDCPFGTAYCGELEYVGYCELADCLDYDVILMTEEHYDCESNQDLNGVRLWTCQRKIRRKKMSKSVLVIDTPENCGKCKFISGFWCRAMDGRRVPNNDVIPNWCPLKPLPEKSTTENDMTDYQCGMVDGRNQCIDEITGGDSDD